MRQTNKYMQGGTVMIIAAGLGLSSTAFSKDSSEPINEAVKTVLEKVEPPVKIAEAPSQRLAVNAGLSQMRLRMRPLRITPKQTEKIESARQAFMDGDKANSTTDINEVIKTVNRVVFFTSAPKPHHENRHQSSIIRKEARVLSKL